MRKLLLSLLFLLSCASIAFGQGVFYIDPQNGSNANNGTSRATAWASHPYQQTSNACTRSTGTSWPGWTHHAGDVYIWIGGENIPAACAPGIIQAGGTTGNNDYYGTCAPPQGTTGEPYQKGPNTSPAACGGTSWPTSGWTQPKIDYAGAVSSGFWKIQSITVTNITFDNMEVVHQGTLASTNVDNYPAFLFYVFGNSSVSTGNILIHMFIHDWQTASEINHSVCGSGCLDYSNGAIAAAPPGSPDPVSSVSLQWSTITDQNGTIVNGGVTKNVPYGGACRQCSEISNSHVSYTMASAFNVTTTHDSELDHHDTGNVGQYDIQVHSQVLEDDGGGNSNNYNNFIHDNKSAVTVDICAGSNFFNSIASGSTNQQPIIISANFCGSPASKTSNVYGNTFECVAVGNCVLFERAGQTIGGVNMRNNIFIGGTWSIAATITNFVQSNNPLIPSGSVTTDCLTIATKFFPCVNDPLYFGAGFNLTSVATGKLAALAQDCQGAEWFGGTYQNRTPRWDIGAYQVGPPPATPQFTCPTFLVAFGDNPELFPATTIVVTCTNTGTATLTIASIVLGGTNPGDFGFITSPAPTCGTSIAASATCSLTFSFTPQALGNRAATVTVTDNASNSPQVFTLTGSGSYYVQACSNAITTAGSTVACTTAKSQIGKVNFCSVGVYDPATTSIALADSNGNVYNPITPLYLQATTGVIQGFLTAGGSIVTGSTDTITATVTPTTTHTKALRCAEYIVVTGLDNQGFSFGSGTAMTSGPVTITGSNDVLIGTDISQATSVTAPGVNYVQRYLLAGDIYEDRIVFAPGSYIADATQTPAAIYGMMFVALSSNAPPPVTIPAPCIVCLVQIWTGITYWGGN